MKKEKGERVPLIWSRHTPSDVVLVPLSTSQGWLDAYFVNIRNCEVKRNTKGNNKQKYLWSDPAINGVSRFFISPSVLLSFCGFHFLSLPPSLSTLDFDFLLIGTMKMRTQDKSAKRQSNGNDQTM